MANRFLLSTLAASAVAAAYYLGKDENREKVAQYVNKEKMSEYVNKEKLSEYVNKDKISQYVDYAKAQIKGETKEDEDEYLREKVGHSDPQDLQDNRMVDEGAATAVNYYNENLKEDVEEDPEEDNKQ
ncbi:hypothetical protein [Alkalicoccus daliensis]|nr:hypothetical protein [Alkalicoccus daliensis]